MINKLNLHRDNSIKAHTQLVYAKNMVFDTETNTLKNELGFKEIFSKNGSVLNITPTNTCLICFIYNASSNQSIIAKAVKNASGVYVYSELINSQYLNFSLNNPIFCEFTYNRKGELILAFLDGRETTSNNVKVLNIDTINLSSPPTKAEIEQFNINQPLSYPTMSFDIDTGGSLLSGTYYIYLAYSKDTQPTNYIFESQQIYIMNKVVTCPTCTNFNSAHSYKSFNQGNVLDITDKHIELNFTNLDSKYTQISLGIVYVRNDVTVGYTKTYEYTGTSLNTILYNLTNFTATDVTNIIQNYINYTKAKTLTKHRNLLLLGNVETDYINYQKYANNIKARYSEDNSSSHCPSDDNALSTIMTFMPNEVYAFYIQLRFTDGTLSEDFHIPGRAISTVELVDGGSVSRIFNEDAYFAAGSSNAPTLIGLTDYPEYVEDASLSTGHVKFFQIRDTNKSTTNELGFWENENELYPDTEDFDVYNVVNGVGVKIGDIRGDKVRHHKIPSEFGVNELIRYRIEFYDIKFPDEIADKIQSYKIKVAKRSNSNSLVDDVGIGVNVENSLQVPSLDLDNVHLALSGSTKKFNFYPFKSLYLRPSLNSSYLKLLQLYTITNNYTIPQNVQSYYNLNGDDVTTIYSTSIFCSYNIPKTDRIRKLGLLEYLLIGNTIDSVDSTYSLSSILAVTINSSIFSYSTNRVGIPLVAFMQYKEDVYLNFIDQETKLLKELSSSLSNTGYLYGDSFYGRTGNRLTSADTSGATIHYYNLFANYNTYSDFNFLVQAEGDGKINAMDSERIYPKLGGDCTDLTIPDSDDGTGNPVTATNECLKFASKPYTIPNYYGFDNASYDTCFNRLNDIKSSIIFNTNIEHENTHPYRIHISLPQTSEMLGIAWNKFIATSYKDVDSAKGEIISLIGEDKKVYIAQRYGLFVNVIKDEFSTGTGNVIRLEESSIFSRPNEEIIPDKLGYIGLLSQFNIINTHLGLFIFSDKHEIYHISGKIGELTIYGISDFLTRRELNEYYNNPIVDAKGGINLGFTKTNNDYRLLLIYNHLDDTTDDRFTLSYSLSNKAWTSFHSYIPNFVIKDREYSLIVDNRGTAFDVYSDNSDDYIGFYFKNGSGVREEQNFIADYIFNSFYDDKGNIFGINLTKLVSNVEFVIDIINTGDEQKVIIYNETVDKVVVYSDTQCTQEIEVNPTNINYFNTDGGINKFNTWYVNGIKDNVKDNLLPFMDKNYNLINSNLILKNWFDFSNFICKFAVVRVSKYLDANKNMYIKSIKANYSINKI